MSDASLQADCQIPLDLSDDSSVRLSSGLTGQRSEDISDSSVKVRADSDCSYASLVKRIVYLSMVLWSLAFRKLLETVTGVKLRKIHIDSRMVEKKSPDWVGYILILLHGSCINVSVTEWP